MTARTLAACLVLALVPAACTRGEPDPGGVDASAALRIIVRDTSEALPRTADLSCGERVEGTNHLADPAKAQAACTLITGSSDAAALLTQQPPGDRMCTQIYGGPQVARVTGTLAGRIIDRTFRRSNGCEIGDWDAVVALIGEPRGGPAETPQ